MKLSQSQIKAQKAILSSIDLLRRFHQVQEYTSVVLFMLIWAKYIPQSKKEVIGFFDVLEGLDNDKKLSLLIDKLTKEVGFEVDYLFGTQHAGNKTVEILETLRTSLIPAGTLLAKGNQADAEWVVDFLKEFSFEKG